LTAYYTVNVPLAVGGGRRRLLELVPVAQPAAIDEHLHDAREGGPGQQPGHGERERVRGPDVEAEPAAERVVGARVGVEPAGDHPDEERGGHGVVNQPHRGAAEHLEPRGDPAGLEAAEHRRAYGLRERDAHPGRADNRHRLEHRGDARPEAEPGPAAFGYPRERHPACERDPEAAGRGGPGREERNDRDVSRARGSGRSRGRHAATVAGAEARSSRLGRLRRVRVARSSRLGRLRGVRHPCAASPLSSFRSSA